MSDFKHRAKYAYAAPEVRVAEVIRLLKAASSAITKAEEISKEADLQDRFGNNETVILSALLRIEERLADIRSIHAGEGAPWTKVEL